MKIRLSLKDESLITPEAEKWIKECEDKLNAQLESQQRLMDLMDYDLGIIKIKIEE